MEAHTSPLRLAVILLLSTMFTACQVWPSGGAPNQVSVPSGKTTSTGFDCPEPNPRVEVASTQLDLLVWSEYIPEEFFECFELVYGIPVQYEEFDSVEQMYDLVTTAQTTVDLIQPTDFVVPRMVREGLLRKLDHARLPSLANFNSHYLDLAFDPDNTYTIPYEAGLDAIVVNTARVKEVPDSWADLWDAQYAGRLLLTDDERTVIGLTLLTLGFDVNSTSPSELEQARRALMVLEPGIAVFDSESPSSRIAEGEVDLGVTWSGEAFMASQQDAAVEFVYPSEGPILWQDNWAMLNTAEHEDAAYAWLNYTMQGDMFWMMLTNFPYTNPNDAALEYARGNPMQVTDVNGTTTTLDSVYSAYIDSTITNPPAEVIRSGHRILDVGEAVALYDEIWAEIVEGE